MTEIGRKIKLHEGKSEEIKETSNELFIIFALSNYCLFSNGSYI